MKTSLECIPCFTRQAAEAIAQTVDDPPRRETLLRKILREISEADWQGSPPVIAQNMHRIIRRELDCRDPYYEIKQRMNATAQRILPALREAMENCPDRLEAAVRLAIGGNLLDAGAKTQIDIDDLPQHMNAIWNRPLQGDVRALFKAAAEGSLAGILGYEERPLVSIDYRTDPRSSIIDALSTMVINGTQVKIYAWYDNEWGYANRTVELARLVGLAG